MDIILIILGSLFTLLKLVGLLNWSWAIVTIPFIACLSVYLIIAIIEFIDDIT